MLYQEGDSAWRCVESFSEFKNELRDSQESALKNESSQTEGSSDSSWVILVRKPDGSGYRQRGPLSREQILVMLNHGEISFTDYAWRKGLKEWYKIMALPEFGGVGKDADSLGSTDRPDRQGSSGEPESSFVHAAEGKEVSRSKIEEVETEKATLKDDGIEKFELEKFEAEKDEIEKEIERVSREILMPGVVGSQKVGPSISNSEVKRHIKRPNPSKVRSRKRKPDGEALARRASWIRHYIESSLVKKILITTVFLVVSSGAVLLLTHLLSLSDRRALTLERSQLPFVDSSKSQKAAPKPTAVRGQHTEKPLAQKKEIPRSDNSVSRVSVSKDMKSVPPDVKAVLPNAKKEDVKTPPTYLKVEKISEGKDDMRLQIMTDGSRHYPISLTFKAEAGRVVGARSFEKAFRIFEVKDREFLLHRKRLPYGFYQLDVEMGSVRTPTQVRYGTNEPDFTKKLHASRKQILLYHNEERYGFLKTVSRLEGEAYKLALNIENAAHLNSWKGFYKSWKKNFDRIQDQTLKKISKKNRDQYVHGDKWLRLKRVHSELENEALSVNRRKARGEAITSQKIKASALELTQLKEQMLRSSLWK